MARRRSFHREIHGIGLVGNFIEGNKAEIGFLAAGVFKLPPMWVYFILCLDEFVKMPVIIAHYYKFGWLKNITRDIV